MMNFASQELNYWGESNNYFDFTPTPAERKSEIKTDSIKLFADKLHVPSVAAQITRPRLIEHLEKSLAKFSATIITGRAGMGKTILAADFAGQSNYCVAWYKVETADADWKIFSSCLLGSINQNRTDELITKFDAGKTTVSVMTESLAARFADAAKEKPTLFVMDDLHSVFDADWFPDFFINFVAAVGRGVHVLLIARTLPPIPLWRLRSKQILGVMDENLLTFNVEETTAFFRTH